MSDKEQTLDDRSWGFGRLRFRTVGEAEVARLKYQKLCLKLGMECADVPPEVFREEPNSLLVWGEAGEKVSSQLELPQPGEDFRWEDIGSWGFGDLYRFKTRAEAESVHKFYSSNLPLLAYTGQPSYKVALSDPGTLWMRHLPKEHHLPKEQAVTEPQVEAEPEYKGWTWGEGARVFKTKAEAALVREYVQVRYPAPLPAPPLRECVEEPTYQLQWVGEDGLSYGSRDGLLPSGSFSMVPLSTSGLRQALYKGPTSWGWVGHGDESYQFKTKAEAERFHLQCTKGYQAKYPLELREEAPNCQLRWLEGGVEYGSKEGLMPLKGVRVSTDLWDSARPLSYTRPAPKGIKPGDLKVYLAYPAAANCSDKELAQKLGGHGMTTDLLVQAIKEALSGKDVLFVVSNMHYADVITRRIAEAIEVRASQNQLTLGNGAKIQVVSVGQLNHHGGSQVLRGRRGSHFIDHYAQVHTRLSSDALRDLEMFSTGFTQPKAPTNPSSWIAGKSIRVSGFIFKTKAEAERWSGPDGWVRVSDLDPDTQLHWWWEGQLYGSKHGLLPPDGVECNTVRLSAPEVGELYATKSDLIESPPEEPSNGGLLLVLGTILGVSTLVAMGSRKTTRYGGAAPIEASEVEVLGDVVEVSAPQGEQYVR